MTYARWRPEFAKAMDERFHPIEWIDWALAKGFLTGFFGEKSALLAYYTDHPGGARTGGVFHALGDIDELETEIRPLAEQWAKSQGCIEIQLDGRRGWIRRLKQYGYRHEKTTVAKGL